MSSYGSAEVKRVVILIGVFLLIAAYSRKPVLLRPATLGTLRIDPDHPGIAAHRTLFTIDILMIVVGVVFLFIERLDDLGVV